MEILTIEHSAFFSLERNEGLLWGLSLLLLPLRLLFVCLWVLFMLLLGYGNWYSDDPSWNSSNPFSLYLLCYEVETSSFEKHFPIGQSMICVPWLFYTHFAWCLERIVSQRHWSSSTASGGGPCMLPIWCLEPYSLGSWYCVRLPFPYRFDSLTRCFVLKEIVSVDNSKVSIPMVQRFMVWSCLWLFSIISGARQSRVEQ